MNRSSHILLMALTCAVAWLVPTTAQGQNTRADLHFFASSRVQTPRIFLGDVARIEGISDRSLGQRLRELDLGKAPAPGQKRNLSRPLIESALRQAGLQSQMKIHYPERIVVHRPGQKISPKEATARVMNAARTYVAEHLPTTHAARIEGLRIRKPWILPQGDLTVVVRHDTRKALRGPVLMTVSVRVGDDQEVLRRQIATRIEVRGPKCKLARSIERGVQITRDDVEEVQESLGPQSLTCAQVIGQETRRAIREGDEPGAQNLKAPKMVSRGQRLTMIYRQGSLRVTAQGEAVVDGVQGDWIPVKNITSKKTLKAMVVAPGVVRVR